MNDLMQSGAPIGPTGNSFLYGPARQNRPGFKPGPLAPRQKMHQWDERLPRQPRPWTTQLPPDGMKRPLGTPQPGLQAPSWMAQQKPGWQPQRPWQEIAPGNPFGQPSGQLAPQKPMFEQVSPMRDQAILRQPQNAMLRQRGY